MKNISIKRIMYLLSAVIIVSGLAGCKDAGVPETTESQGIAHNDIKFEIIEDETVLPVNIRSHIENNKGNRGYIWYEDGAGYYVIIFAGEKMTGGHGIKVNRVEDIEGITKITVEEWAPGKDEYVTQALTYPQTVIRIEGVTDNFEVVGTDGSVYEFHKITK